MDYILFQLHPVAGRRGTDSKFHLVQPKSQVRQKTLHVGNDYFVFGQYFVELLPLRNKLIELVFEPTISNHPRSKLNLHPSALVERNFTNYRQTGLNQAANHRTTGINRSFMDYDFE